MLGKITKNKYCFAIKKFHWKMFLAICAQFLIPAIYSTITSIWLSNIGQEKFAISSSWTYISIINNVIEEGIVFSIYSFIGKIAVSEDQYLKKSRVKICYILIFVLTIISLLIINNFVYLFTIHSFSPVLANEYLSLKLWTILPQNIGLVSIAIYISIDRIRYVYLITILETAMTFIFDYIFLYQKSIFFSSLMGDAYSTMIVQTLTAIISLIIISVSLRFTIKEWFTIKWRKNLKPILKPALGASLNSFFRNSVYLFLIVKIIAGLHNNEFRLAGYNAFNQLMWVWLLIPIQAIAGTLKAKIANNFTNEIKVNELLLSGILISSIIIIIWILFIPLWFLIMNFMLNINKNPQIGFYAKQAFEILFLFFIPYAYSVVCFSYIYAYGKNLYIAFASFVVNIIAAIPALIIIEENKEFPFQYSVLYFGITMLIGSLFDIATWYFVWRKRANKYINERTENNYLVEQ